MRLFHTADWHVGKTIRDQSRMEEFAAALDEVLRIATDERVDAVLVAGDLYESRAPSPEADQLLVETFLRFHEVGIPIVAIPGNHDSAPRWKALAPLLRFAGVEVVPAVAPPDQGSAITVPSRDGSEAAVVACVPFVAERYFANAAKLFESAEAWSLEYAEGMGQLLDAMTKAFRADRVNVLMAHLYVTNAIVGGGELEITLTPDYAISPARLPGTAQYIALGHIHRPQAVSGAPAPARYAGSLLQLDFGERQQVKSVAVVEVSAGRPAKVREIPLRAGRRLLDVAGTFDELRARADELADAYLRVTVNTDGPVPGLSDQVREILPGAMYVKAEYAREEEDGVLSGSSLMSLSHREQFRSFYKAKHQIDPSEEIVAAFEEVYAAAS